MVNASNSGPGFPVPPCENLELFNFSVSPYFTINVVFPQKLSQLKL